MKRLTDEQLKMAVDKSTWIDASPHEWPTQEDIWLLCNAVLDSRAEVASRAQTLAEGNRASDYALDVMRRILGRQDIHGIEEGAGDVAALVNGLRGELAAAKEDASKAWGEFRALSVRAGENYHNLRMRFGAIEDRAARWEERFLSAYNLLRTTLRELGGVAEPGASLEFLEGVPDEAAAVVKSLRETEAHAAEFRDVMTKYYQNYMLDEAEDPENAACGHQQHLAAKAVGEALERTPAQSLATIQARTLRELKSRIVECDQCGEVVFWSVVENKAERLEKQ